MKQNKKFILSFILIMLIFTVSGTLASRTHMNFQLEYLNNKLSVNVEKVALGSVLAKIQEKTGIKFQLDKEASDRIISVSFQPLPITKALKRILNNLSHLVLFGPNGNILEVIIIGKIKKSLKSPIHERKIFSTSNTMIIEPPGGEKMEVTQPSDTDAMVIGPPSGEEMKITHGGEPMKITFSPDDMKITSPSYKAHP